VSLDRFDRGGRRVAWVTLLVWLQKTDLDATFIAGMVRPA
jgi:hypothetical protein